MGLHLSCAILGLAAILGPAAAWAGEPPPLESGDLALEEVLEGFDAPGGLENGAAGATDGLDEVLDGFDGPDGTRGRALEDPAGREDRSLDDVLAGFGDEEGAAGPAMQSAADGPGWLDIFGSVTLGLGWNLAHEAPEPGRPDYRELSMLRLTGALGADVDLGSWKLRLSGHGWYDGAWSAGGERSAYTGAYLDSYESELEADEVYLSGSLGRNVDIKTGRQVVVWGKADNVRVTDVLNPLDNRVPGMTDIKYRRLPVTMSRADLYLGPWSLTGLVIHEVRLAKNPVYNGEFYPFSSPPPPERPPTNWSAGTQQSGLALSGIFSGWDMALYQAWIFDPRARLDPLSGELVHDRVAMSGATANLAVGNWLFKAEAAWWQGLRFARAPDEDFFRLDLMAGIEYTGFNETVLSMETVNRHLQGYDPLLAQPPDLAQEDILQTALMVSRDFLHDSLTIKVLATLFGAHAEDGAFMRIQADYDLDDQTTLRLGSVLYQDGDLPSFATIGDCDRIFVELRWSF